MQRVKLIIKICAKHWAVLSVVLTILASASICTIIYFNQKNTKIAERSKKHTESHLGTVVLSAEVDSKRQAEAPSSGSIDYQFLTTYQGASGNNITYIYLTSEYHDDRLIELNDQVIADLESEGKITDQTESYAISYFNDRTTANTYFIKVNDPSTSVSERLKIKDSYVASMTYSKQLGLNFLVKIGTAKILKKY